MVCHLNNILWAAVCFECLAIAYQMLMLPSLFLEFPFNLCHLFLPQLIWATFSGNGGWYVPGLLGQSANPPNSFLSSLHFFLWSDSCIGLPDIPHAVWDRRDNKLSNQEVFEVGTELKYQCKFGYRPIPEEPLTLTCQENFTWTASKGCECK